MSYAYELHPQARAELAEAYVWYENERPGAGERFAESVNDKIKSINHE
jgi:plasmid stabilization system protein ParE